MPLVGEDDEEDVSEESDVDDFIVDDNGEPISKPAKGQKKRTKGDSYVLASVSYLFTSHQKHL